MELRALKKYFLPLTFPTTLLDNERIYIRFSQIQVDCTMFESLLLADRQLGKRLRAGGEPLLSEDIDYPAVVPRGRPMTSGYMDWWGAAVLAVRDGRIEAGMKKSQMLRPINVTLTKQGKSQICQKKVEKHLDLLHSLMAGEGGGS